MCTQFQLENPKEWNYFEGLSICEDNTENYVTETECKDVDVEPYCSWSSWVVGVFESDDEHICSAKCEEFTGYMSNY
jgi:hypothetical protein